MKEITSASDAKDEIANYIADVYTPQERDYDEAYERTYDEAYERTRERLEAVIDNGLAVVDLIYNHEPLTTEALLEIAQYLGINADKQLLRQLEEYGFIQRTPGIDQWEVSDFYRRISGSDKDMNAHVAHLGEHESEWVRSHDVYELLTLSLEGNTSLADAVEESNYKSPTMHENTQEERTENSTDDEEDTDTDAEKDTDTDTDADTEEGSDAETIEDLAGEFPEDLKKGLQKLDYVGGIDEIDTASVLSDDDVTELEITDIRYPSPPTAEVDFRPPIGETFTRRMRVPRTPGERTDFGLLLRMAGHNPTNAYQLMNDGIPFRLVDGDWELACSWPEPPKSLFDRLLDYRGELTSRAQETASLCLAFPFVATEAALDIVVNQQYGAFTPVEVSRDITFVMLALMVSTLIWLTALISLAKLIIWLASVNMWWVSIAVDILVGIV